MEVVVGKLDGADEGAGQGVAEDGFLERSDDGKRCVGADEFEFTDFALTAARAEIADVAPLAGREFDLGPACGEGGGNGVKIDESLGARGVGSLKFSTDHAVESGSGEVAGAGDDAGFRELETDVAAAGE